MARVKRTNNSGEWTDARFRQFIMSALRQASGRWGPKARVLREARLSRGVYLCEGWKRSSHETTASVLHNGKRVKNAQADHIQSVIDPEKGFVSWDEVVSRMFVEVEGYQVLCKQCHDKKTAEERQIRNDTRKRKASEGTG